MDDPQIAVWNRATEWDVEVALQPGDVALRDVIRFDGPAQNGGPVHALGVVGEEGTALAIAGFRFLELHEAAEVLVWLQSAVSSLDPDDDDAGDALEEESNDRYYAAVEGEAIDAAFARLYQRDPAAFAPVG